MKNQGIQVIARAGAILRVCAEAKSGLSLAAIAKEVSLPRSTVQRIVSALAGEGLLFSDGSHRSIRLGGELFQVAAQHHLDVVEIIHPFLKDLSEVTGETVDLAVLRGSRLVFIDQVTGSQRLRAVSSVGEAFSLHNSANGKAVLSLMTPLALQRVLKIGPRFQTRALKSLLAEFEQVRSSGIAEDSEEHTSGISAVGTAFCVAGGFYAISIPMPSIRFAAKKEKIKVYLLECRNKIEEACRIST
jgi:DNA-binding IclR family transcriptional regulator